MRLPGPEHDVPGTIDETPLTWSPSGALLALDRDGHLVVRTTDGRLLAESQIKRGLIAVEPASDSVLYVTPSDELVRTDGLRTTRFGDVSRLAGDPRGIEALADGSTAVFGPRRIAIIGPSGRLIASAPVRRRALLTQDVSASPDGRGYAYVLTTRRQKGGTDTCRAAPAPRPPGPHSRDHSRLASGLRMGIHRDVERIVDRRLGISTVTTSPLVPDHGRALDGRRDLSTNGHGESASPTTSHGIR